MIIDNDRNSKETTRIIHIELTGIAEGIIDDYTYIDIKEVTIIYKENGWKNISFEYKDTS